MNLQPINPPLPASASIFCAQCNTSSRAEGAFADLEGEPFRAFYCLVCTKAILPPGEAVARLDAQKAATDKRAEGLKDSFRCFTRGED